MSLQATLDKISGAQERIETALQAQNTAESALAIANARIVDLESAVGSAPDAARITDFEAQISALTTRAGAAEAALATAAARVTELEASQANFEGRVNAGVASALAANGQPPVSTAIKPTQEAGAKKPGDGLTGLARVVAIEKAESAARKI